MHSSRRLQRLLALFAVAWLLLNAPLIALWDVPVRVLGLPLFPVALFVGWAVLIGVAAWVAEGPGMQGVDDYGLSEHGPNERSPGEHSLSQYGSNKR